MIRETAKPWHLAAFRPQLSQREVFENTDTTTLLNESIGFALIDQNENQVEEPFALFFLRPLDDSGRYLALTYLSELLGYRRLSFAARQARSYLDEWGEYRRIEAYCPDDAIDEHHWCRYVLKMQLEGVLRAFLADGRDMYLFARVNNGR